MKPIYVIGAGLVGGLLGVGAVVTLEAFTGVLASWTALIVGLLTGLAIWYAGGSQSGPSYWKGAIASLMTLALILLCRSAVPAAIRTRTVSQTPSAL